VAIFEAFKPTFDLRSTQCIIAESMLNLPDCFRFGISELLAKLDAVPLLHTFSHWTKYNVTSTYYSISHASCLVEKDTPGEAAKNHACA
jgi:hypothetical protein